MNMFKSILKYSLIAFASFFLGLWVMAYHFVSNSVVYESAFRTFSCYPISEKD